MFKLLYHPGEIDDPEADVIAEASNRLDVGEFQVFQLGYESWYGRAPDSQMIELCFVGYLTDNRMPPWARHYAREIIKLDDGGGLDSTDPVYHRFDPPHRAPARIYGWSILLGTLGVVALFLTLIAVGGEMVDAPPCMFPPCH